MDVRAITAREMRNNFRKIADDAAEFNDVFIIPRRKGKNVVLISEKEFRSWQETNYLLATKANREALQEGMHSDHSSKRLTPEEWDKLVGDNE